jgi:hypothetical protein
MIQWLPLLVQSNAGKSSLNRLCLVCASYQPIDVSKLSLLLLFDVTFQQLMEIPKKKINDSEIFCNYYPVKVIGTLDICSVLNCIL